MNPIYRGNLFQEVDKLSKGSKQRVIEVLLDSRYESLPQEKTSWEQLAFDDAATNTNYEGNKFNNGLFTLIRELNSQGKLLISEPLPNEINNRMIITGRNLFTYDERDHQLHSRSFLGTTISTSGMHYGPQWGILNGSDITKFGKVIAVNCIAKNFLILPWHTGESYILPKMILRVPIELEGKFKSARKPSPNSSYLNVDYYDLAKEILQLSSFTTEILEELDSEVCLFYDAHDRSSVNKHNLSDKMCLFHKFWLENFRGESNSTSEKILEYLRGKEYKKEMIRRKPPARGDKILKYLREDYDKKRQT